MRHFISAHYPDYSRAAAAGKESTETKKSCRGRQERESERQEQILSPPLERDNVFNAGSRRARSAEGGGDSLIGRPGDGGGAARAATAVAAALFS